MLKPAKSVNGMFGLKDAIVMRPPLPKMLPLMVPPPSTSRLTRGASGSGTVVSPNFTTALLETTRPICGNTAIVAPLRGVNSSPLIFTALREIRRSLAVSRGSTSALVISPAFTVHLPLNTSVHDLTTY